MDYSSSITKEKPNDHWYVVATVCIGAFVAALDASIINIALPSLQQQFHSQMNEIEWVSLSYLLSLASLILIFGRLADIIGRRWLYIIGFGIFSISSLLCGFAPSLFILIISRVFQGMGAALLQANSVSIITFAAPKEDLGKAIGFQASAQGIGLSLGPVVGGTLLSFVNWKWLFFINLPVGIIGMILGVLFLPKDSMKINKINFDVLGSVFLIPSLITVIYILNMGLKMGWGSPLIVACYFISVLTSILFYRTERKKSQPLVDFTLFKHSYFTIGNLTSMMSFIIMYAVLLLTPYYLDHVKHLPVFQASFFITFVPIGMTISTPISGMMSDRLGPGLPSILGLAFATIGTLLLSFIGSTGTNILMCLGLFLAGAGIGMFTPPNNSNVMGKVPKNALGVSGGILNMSRTLGMGLGVTLGGLSYQFFLSVFGHNQVDSMIYAFRSSYFVIAILSFITFLITVNNHKKEQKKAGGYHSKGIEA
ncbi:MFS transporter [Bacillus sp. OTU2372]|uniref:MFS transporter n=1 Tax=Bacillus sp. OTU2372 TaxID=3043858 RepID=UPI00313D7C24